MIYEYVNPVVNTRNTIILIIDDNATNIEVLVGILKTRGFEIITARNGSMGIKRAKFSQPDLILLDIKMPEMDGYKVCEYLKTDENTKYIPVIFISALNETISKVKAFDIGGVDYITKPFHEGEVLARIKSHLVLQAHKKQLQIQNEKLIQLSKEKNEFLSIAAHDLKNPLNAVFGSLQLIEMIIETEKFSNRAKVVDYVKIMYSSVELMLELINRLLDVNSIETGKLNLNLQNDDILPMLRFILDGYFQKAKDKKITIHFTPKDTQYIAHSDVSVVQQILDNLISNAIKYSPFEKNVYIHIFTTENNSVCCEIQDEGPGLSSEEQTQLFQKFSRLTPLPTNNETSTGLGLFIVKKLVTAMDGKVWCESELGKGTKFTVEFMPPK
ncbi:MAG: hybrid sensor histidine kinase/response regulator [Proteobacteria bacterium]|nr:hybrid sensor histidine kinase/response regulator [Pseudomonadota bacterium]